MMQPIAIPDGDLDLLAIGETLVDLISVEQVESLQEATTFRRYAGGSPANIAANVVRLGGRAAILSKVGADAPGRFLQAELARVGVDTAGLLQAPGLHTSLVLVSRSGGTPDFDVFREADYRLEPADVPAALVARARVVHASTWPLSREPARAAVEQAFRLAQAAGKVISLDPNYSPKVWPDREEARRVLQQMMQYATITKPSADDARRLWGEGLTPEAYIARFHALGPRVVVFTMGASGIILSVDGEQTFIPAQPVKVVDTTGAGDSFWAGFIVALLDGNPLGHCALFAREVVGRKLVTVGPLSDPLDRQELYHCVAQVIGQLT